MCGNLKCACNHHGYSSTCLLHILLILGVLECVIAYKSFDNLFHCRNHVGVWINDLLQCNLFLALITNQGHELFMIPICVMLARRTFVASAYTSPSHIVCWIVFIYCIHLLLAPIVMLWIIYACFIFASSSIVVWCWNYSWIFHCIWHNWSVWMIVAFQQAWWLWNFFATSVQSTKAMASCWCSKYAEH